MSNKDLELKDTKLRAWIKEQGKIAVAYSSGVDSTYLLKVAKEVLGDNVLAITVSSSVFPQRELEEAIEFCDVNSIRHTIIKVDELAIPGFKENPKDRCYICKRAIFSKIINEANAAGIHIIVEGSNKDDDSDYRPGHKAIKELGILSPLRECELYKNEIRQLSKKLGLSTADKASFACLASRVPYGDMITKEKLHMVETAEEFLRSNGFKQFRVRVHGTIARIELLQEDISRLLENGLRDNIVEEFKAIGFTYVSVDLEGYRTGSMNETII